jgi:hypothetical protein
MNFNYTVNASKTMNVDVEEAQDLTRLVLEDDFASLSEDINRLRNKFSLESYEANDLGNFIEMRNAIKTVLRFYSTKEQYDEFMEVQRVYGNVQ